MNSIIPYLKSFDYNTLKKNRMGRGHQTDKQTDRRTSRLLDRIGPVGRFGENKPAAQAAGADPPPLKLHQYAKSTPSVK